MIQISSPPQVSHSPVEGELHPENAVLKVADGDSADFSGKAGGTQSRNKLGFFAKLLEGLISKSKKEGLGAGVSEKVKVEFNAGEAKNTLESGKSRIRIEAPMAEPVVLGDEGFFGEELAFFGQETGQKEINSGYPKEIPVQDSPENHFFGVGAGLINQNIENLSPLIEEGEQQNSSANLQSASGAKALSENSAFYKGENTKASGPEKADFLSFSFRETEAQFLQSREMRRSGQSGNEGGEKENSPSQGRKDRPSIEVRDLRSFRYAQQEASMSDTSKGQAFEAAGPEAGEIDIPVDLELLAGKGEAEGINPGKPGREILQGRFMEDALARELRGNLSTDIVRNAMIIVRDGDEGTIRLSLRPASLGDVKISLEMVENKITGHIILESNEALRAFEREIHSLEKAFRDSGFSEANLSLSLQSEGWNYGGQERQPEGEVGTFSAALAASRYEAGASAADGYEDLHSSGMITSGETGLSGTPGRISVNLLV